MTGKVPIIVPQTMDNLLVERRDSEGICAMALARGDRKTFMTQLMWAVRINLIISRKAIR